MPRHPSATLFSRLRALRQSFAGVVDTLVHGTLATTSLNLLNVHSNTNLLTSFFSAFRDARPCDVAAPSATASCHTTRIIPE
jgi:hypothetical protein